MNTSPFLTSSLTLIYAAVSVFLCVLVYKGKAFARFDWHAEGMNKVLGSGRIRQVDINSGDPAHNAAVAAGNLTNNMTPGNGAALFVLAFFLFGCFAGSVAIPAALGLVSTITTLNLASLIVAGFAWGLGLGRVTMSMTVFGFKLAIWTLMLAVLLFALNFVLSFLNGGKDAFWDSAASKVIAAKNAAYNYDSAPKGSWFYNYEAHRKQNLCAVYEAIRTKGNIDATRRECDGEAWAHDQKVLQKDAQTAYLLAEEKHKATIKKWTMGIPSVNVEPNTSSALGTWSRVTQCNGNDVIESYLITGDASNLHGVAMFYFFKGQASDIDNYTAYKFTGTQVGNAVDLHAGDWIQKGTLGKKTEHHFILNSGKYPNLKEDAPTDGCPAMALIGARKQS